MSTDEQLLAMMLQEVLEEMNYERGWLRRQMKPRMPILLQSSLMAIICFACALYLLLGSFTEGRDYWRIAVPWAGAAGWCCVWFGVRRPMRIVFYLLRFEWRLHRLKATLTRLRAVKNLKGQS